MVTLWRVCVSLTSRVQKIKWYICLCFPQSDQIFNISLPATSEGQIVLTAFGLVWVRYWLRIIGFTVFLCFSSKWEGFRWLHRTEVWNTASYFSKLLIFKCFISFRWWWASELSSAIMQLAFSCSRTFYAAWRFFSQQQGLFFLPFPLRSNE